MQFTELKSDHYLRSYSRLKLYSVIRCIWLRLTQNWVKYYLTADLPGIAWVEVYAGLEVCLLAMSVWLPLVGEAKVTINGRVR